MKHPTSHIFEHTPDTLRAWCAERGMKPFRAQQILEWVYAHGECDPAKMSNLSARDRDILAAEMTFLSGRTLAHQVATDGTQKLLIQWSDGDPDDARDVADPLAGTLSRSLPVLNAGGFDYAAGDPTRQTECVMIPVDADETREDGPTSARRTACISSQVGCPVGCRFCASGLSGLDGNLSAGRIVEQVWRLGRLEGVGRISNIVFMGMGEPLSNFRPVVSAVRTIAAPWGLGIGARRITISTVGLPQAIEKLARELELPVTLALSLHAPNDELRRELIPWANYTSIDELFQACRVWFEKTGREITLEYTLLHGVNDRPEHAQQLAGVAKKLRGNVNLIRYNEVGGLEFKRPETVAVREFQEILRARGVNAHIRASRGRDIAAACGQLRHETSV
ncbi:MAG: 23S rRNA (adenine(2503)-C(2))-methyltransferase RlmN [Phycisphaerales bacterium JB037]